jgi:membrane protease YdiL (CAAX protease family)
MNAVTTGFVEIARPQRGYLRETSQPVYSAALILPFLVVYEFGLIFLRSDVINGGDAILLNLGGPLMRLLGVHASVVSLLVLGIYFIVLQFRKSQAWTLHWRVLGLLFVESLFYALLLFVMLGLLLKHLPGMNVERPELNRQMTMAVQTPASANLAPATVNTPVRAGPGPKDFVLFCGAGVYEELVFRVLLLGLLMLIFTKLLHMEHAYAAVWSTLFGAVLFSAFHHIGGERFILGIFSQRVFAGVFFSAIYFTRSFGVAAASHAFYDILVGMNLLS